jgi:hypothetical protein
MYALRSRFVVDLDKEAGMVDVTYPTTALAGDSRFDAFLSESIGEQENGMHLSVLSALSRREEHSKAFE